MKRSLFGAVLLAVLLAAGISSSTAMYRCHSDLAGVFADAAVAARTEDWSRAEGCLEEGVDRWEELWRVSAAFFDHKPMEEVDSLLEEARLRLGQRDSGELSAVCARLSRMLRTMADAQVPGWWNLL